ncbi:ABC transporter permease [Streptomyces sp. NPDC046727]|uniref:ABC transporter permease n=1 Tax=Streptomyces sp. NPDC046727 TaxID=3155373 RepID=UPI0033FBEB51
MAGAQARYSGAAVSAARILFLAGFRSYRALFRWLTPSAFIPTLIGVPLVQLVWFAYLGDYLGTRPISYYVVGNAIVSCAVAGLFAPAMSVSGERLGGSLPALLATPANRVLVFTGRLIPAVLTGFLTTVFLFVVGVLFTDLRVPSGSVLPLVLVLLATSTSCGAFGLVIGAIGLRTRQAPLIGNLTLNLMLLLCGVNIPLTVLPPVLQVLGKAMPMTYGIEAARRVLAGDGQIGHLVSLELLKALGYLAVALVALRYLEISGKRHAHLDLA